MRQKQYRFVEKFCFFDLIFLPLAQDCGMLLDRIHACLEDKEQRLQAARDKKAELEVKGCTFAPQLAHTPGKVVHLKVCVVDMRTN